VGGFRCGWWLGGWGGGGDGVVAGAGWEGAGKRTPCAGRAVITHSSPEPSAAGSEGACSEGYWQAHSVRRESCDYSQQSRAFGCWFGGGL
jgi:hypothetical protein